jgi:hypothetical protein
VTKKTASWGVSSVEAMVVVNDFARQADYSFDVVLAEMAELVAEEDAHAKVQAERSCKAKKARLEAELQQLDAEKEGSEAEAAERVVAGRGGPK